MTDALTPCTAFDGSHRLAAGPLAEVALAVKARGEADPAATLLTFDDATGAVIDLDLRGTPEDVVSRLGASVPVVAERRSRGRPKLGVVAREVTLLPRQWDWLARQPGGASAALRRLVDAARRDDSPGAARAAREAAYRFMAAMAGNLPGFEEAARALFADDRARFRAHAAAWPADICAYAEALAWPPATAR
jgi:uncharacterized protein